PSSCPAELTTANLIQPGPCGRTPPPGQPYAARNFQCAVRVCRCATHSTLAAHSRCRRSACAGCTRLAATTHRLHPAVGQPEQSRHAFPRRTFADLHLLCCRG